MSDGLPKNPDKVVIALSANNQYVPYISVLLHSIVAHVSASRDYEVIIFNQDIYEENRQFLSKEFSSKSNVTLTFHNISNRLSEYKNLFTHGHFAVETYFRLFFPDVLSEYKKVLHLDGDMIINTDIADLFDTDVEEYLLAACLDPDTAGLYNGFDPGRKEYMDTILKIKEPYHYFQAGVVLFNLEEMRNTYSVSDLLTFAQSYTWKLLDQDVLNYIAQGRVKFIDMSWNVMHDWGRMRVSQIISLAPQDLVNTYHEARKSPKIVHFAGPEKPWQVSDCDFAQYFWPYARKSVFYEIILSRVYLSTVQKMEKTLREEFLEQYERKLYDRKLSSKLKKVVRAAIHKVCPSGTKRRKALATMRDKMRRRGK